MHARQLNTPSKRCIAQLENSLILLSWRFSEFPTCRIHLHTCLFLDCSLSRRYDFLCPPSICLRRGCGLRLLWAPCRLVTYIGVFFSFLFPFWAALVLCAVPSSCLSTEEIFPGIFLFCSFLLLRVSSVCVPVPMPVRRMACPPVQGEAVYRWVRDWRLALRQGDAG